MAPSRRCAVAQEIAWARLLEIGDRFAQPVSRDAALLRIPLALDVPELEQVEHIREGHPVEIIRVEALLDIAQLHRAHKNLERVAATITATRPIWIRLRHDHAFVPKILRNP